MRRAGGGGRRPKGGRPINEYIKTYKPRDVPRNRVRESPRCILPPVIYEVPGRERREIRAFSLLPRPLFSALLNAGSFRFCPFFIVLPRLPPGCFRLAVLFYARLRLGSSRGKLLDGTVVASVPSLFFAAGSDLRGARVGRIRAGSLTIPERRTRTAYPSAGLKDET